MARKEIVQVSRAQFLGVKLHPELDQEPLRVITQWTDKFKFSFKNVLIFQSSLVAHGHDVKMCILVAY